MADFIENICIRSTRHEPDIRYIGGGHSKPSVKTPWILKWHDGQNPLDTKEGVVKTPLSVYSNPPWWYEKVTQQLTQGYHDT